jgi:hypothetical protein
LFTKRLQYHYDDSVEYKASKPVPPEQMEKLEKLPQLQPDTSIYSIGEPYIHLNAEEK